MDENRQAHLEMIQGVINRMGSNSFSVRAWAIGLMTGLVALGGDRITQPAVLASTTLGVLLLWYLDAFYVRQERLFRRLFDDARGGTLKASEGAFSMSVTEYEDTVTFWKAARSRTVVPIYGVLLVMLGLFCLRGGC
jgi:hypothetical protein